MGAITDPVSGQTPKRHRLTDRQEQERLEDGEDKSVQRLHTQDHMIMKDKSRAQTGNRTSDHLPTHNSTKTQLNLYCRIELSCSTLITDVLIRIPASKWSRELEIDVVDNSF